MLEKSLESPLDSKEIKPVYPKWNEPWIFMGRTDAEAEALMLWPPDVKSWLIGKDPDAGKDWGQEKGVTEGEMVGWHHQLNGHECEQTLGDSEGQGSLGILQFMGLQSWTWFSNWIATLFAYSKSHYPSFSYHHIGFQPSACLVSTI